MAIKIIVSYDGTDNDRDALAFGRLLTQVGASLELAYVRHAPEAEPHAERLAETDAAALLEIGAGELGDSAVPRHVILSASTPLGLRELAQTTGAGLIAFGSAYRTARGHVDPQPSARRLLDGGSVALAVAPAGFADVASYTVGTVAYISEDGDPCPQETAESLAGKFGASLTAHGIQPADLIVVGSKPGTVNGRVTISAAAEYLIELSLAPVIVLPRGVTLNFA